MLSEQFNRFQKSFETALKTDLSLIKPDPNVYSSENLGDFGLEFLSYIDPVFVQDIDLNRDWYLNSFRESP